MEVKQHQRVATVSANGKVKGIWNGTATITATAKDGSGMKTYCKITVKQTFIATPMVTKMALSNTKTVKITWTKSAKATHYQVYRSTNSNSGFKRIATVKGTSYTNKNLTAGKTYYFKVRALKKAKSGKKTYSGYSTAKPVKMSAVKPRSTAVLLSGRATTATILCLPNPSPTATKW